MTDEEKARLVAISNALFYNTQELKRWQREGGKEPSFKQWKET